MPCAVKAGQAKRSQRSSNFLTFWACFYKSIQPLEQISRDQVAPEADKDQEDT